MTVSLVEILAAARAHAAPLAAESAGYLLLAVADHVVSAPRAVVAGDVELSSDGSVRLHPGRGASADGDAAEASVRHLLSRALQVSGSAGPALRRAVERREATGLSALVRELEVALIPVNRAAAKRALSRLYRETERARVAGRLDDLLVAEHERDEARLPAGTIAPAPAAEPQLVPEPERPAPLDERTPPPAVELAPPRRPAPAPVVALTLTPEPVGAVDEPALTKPEPVVARARERGSSTPRLGTVVTAQTLPSEEAELTERAPEVLEELELSVKVESLEGLRSEEDDELLDEVTPALPSKIIAVAEALSPDLVEDPEPSLLPDVLSAMVELHAGFDVDEAPTRLREVVTELRAEPEPLPAVAAAAVAPCAPAPPPAIAVTSVEPWLTPEPEPVEDAWLTASSLEGVFSAPTLFVSELASPELHEALTWDPGPVVAIVSSPVPPALFMTEPAVEPSPYAPAVLPAPLRDVSELVDSFHVSGASEEQDLRSALKEMAGLELTPMPHPLLEKC